MIWVWWNKPWQLLLSWFPEFPNGRRPVAQADGWSTMSGLDCVWSIHMNRVFAWTLWAPGRCSEVINACLSYCKDCKLNIFASQPEWPGPTFPLGPRCWQQPIHFRTLDRPHLAWDAARCLLALQVLPSPSLTSMLVMLGHWRPCQPSWALHPMAKTFGNRVTSASCAWSETPCCITGEVHQANWHRTRGETESQFSSPVVMPHHSKGGLMKLLKTPEVAQSSQTLYPKLKVWWRICFEFVGLLVQQIVEGEVIEFHHLCCSVCDVNKTWAVVWTHCTIWKHDFKEA